MSLVRAWLRAPVDLTGGIVLSPGEEKNIDTSPAHEQTLIASGALTVITGTPATEPVAFEQAIIEGAAPPFVLRRYHLRDFPSIRDHSKGKPTGDADNTQAFGEMLAEPLISSLLVPPHAPGSHYNVTDIVMCTRDRITLHSHEGALAEVKQQLLGRPTFFISGADCAASNIRAGSGPTLTTRPSWSFDKLSSADNLLVNQDATSSRWAGWYLWGAQRFKGWRMGWQEAYCGIRVRPRDRFSTDPTAALFGVEIINPSGRRHVFGVNAMGWASGTLRGMRSQETLSVDTVPPHALYLAGAGNIPSDIVVPGHPVTSSGATFSTGSISHGFTAGAPVEFDNLVGGGTEVQTGVIYYVLATGLTTTAFQIATAPGGTAITPSVAITAGFVTGTPDIDFDGDSDVPAGKADLPMRLFLLADCIDYDNQWSSSYKIRNGFGIGVHDIFSHRAAMAFQASYLERCHLSRIEAHDAVQIYSQSTNLPADSGTQEMGQLNFCSWNLIDDVFLHSELGRYVGGLSLRNACGHNRIRRPHVALNVTSDGGRAHYKAIDSSRNILENPGVDLKGVAMIPFRGFNAEDNLIDRPRVDAGTLTVPTIARFDNDSLRNEIAVERRRLSSGVGIAVTDDTGGGTNFASFPEDDAGLAHAGETAPSWMGGLATLALTGQLAKGSRFVPSHDFTATKLKFEVTTADAANPNCLGAIVEAVSGRVVAVSTSQALFGTTGEQSLALTAGAALKKGRAYVAWLVNPSATSAVVLRATSLGSNVVSNFHSAAGTVDAEYQHKAAVTTFGAVGSTFASGSARADAPIIGVLP